MSNFSENSGSIPPRWLHCPRKAVKLIQNKFLAFKTPLSSAYDSQVPEECRFSIDMLMASLRSERIKMGLWIDLTNTKRFYDKKDVEAHGCKYLKLQCRGHGETPSEEQTRTFVQVCKNFIAQNPLEIVGVHCTHGFNRTGFLIVSYIVEIDGTSVDAGLAKFATSRPPGIYKGDYIKELYRRYDDVEDAPKPPARPAWCLEYDDEDEEDTDQPSNANPVKPESRHKRREFNCENPIFMAGVPRVTAILDSQKLHGVRTRVQEICHWQSSGFPGSQPVSMDCENLRLLHEKPYKVSWKADGTRYMMFIQSDGDVYFLDRDNSVFQVDGLTFPHPGDLTRHIGDTLLDGEMVIDKDNGREYPRYLVYDIIALNGKNVMEQPFHPNRCNMIRCNIVETRIAAMKKGIITKEREPFSVRQKDFWDITMSESLLSDKFASQLAHEPDGLIFQPSAEPYTPGLSPEVLKWKPLSLNSIDFKLKIVKESGEGIVPRKIGHLYVGGHKYPFGKILITRQIKDLDNAIIECKFHNGEWVFMRERTDKSFPNSVNTAQSVWKSILKPLTKEDLLSYIRKRKYVTKDSDLMPPPPKKRC